MYSEKRSPGKTKHILCLLFEIRLLFANLSVSSHLRFLWVWEPVGKPVSPEIFGFPCSCHIKLFQKLQPEIQPNFVLLRKFVVPVSCALLQLNKKFRIRLDSNISPFLGVILARSQTVILFPCLLSFCRITRGVCLFPLSINHKFLHPRWWHRYNFTIPTKRVSQRCEAELTQVSRLKRCWKAKNSWNHLF